MVMGMDVKWKESGGKRVNTPAFTVQLNGKKRGKGKTHQLSFLPS